MSVIRKVKKKAAKVPAKKAAGGAKAPAVAVNGVSRDAVLSALRAGIRAAGGDVELLFIGLHTGTTRFAASGIHQNMMETDLTVTARVAVGRKLGVATLNSLSRGDILSAIRQARESAKCAQPLREFEGFAGRQTYGPAPLPDPGIVRQDPADRAAALVPLFATAGRSKTELHGALLARWTQMGVVNSNGLEAWHEGTMADAQFIAMDPGGGGSGYAADAGRGWGALDLPTLAETAVKKCVLSRHPRDLDPGVYEVILEPAAVAEIFAWLPWIAFSGRSVEDGASFLKDKFGTQIATDPVTIYDDGLDAEGLPLPFDFEGRAKKAVYFVDKGVAREVVHDVVSAARAKSRPTGHAPFPGMAPAGAAMNLFVASGMSSVEEMIAQTRRGVLVTRFHYLNGLLNPPVAMFTGMTRDGAYWVEDGKVRHPIRNMRWTNSIARALQCVELVGRDRVVTPNSWSPFGSATVPALKLREWQFDSKTEF